MELELEQELGFETVAIARDRDSVLNDVRPMIETMPLEQAAQAYDKMLAGNARFRMVLTTGA